MILFIKKPQKYTPSGNPIIYQISTDNPNVIYFKVNILEVNSVTILSTLKYYPTPVSPNTVYFNLQIILSSFVDSEMVNSNAVCVGVNKPIKNFKVIITEVVINNGVISDGYTYDGTNENFYVFNAEIPEPLFNYFNNSEFVLTTGKNINFLSTKPNNSYVNFWSTEYLYFINTPTSGLNNVQIKTFSKDGLKATYSSNITIGVDNMFRLNVSPKSLKYSLSVDFDLVTYYTIQLLNLSGIPLTELKAYNAIDVRCGTEPVNIIWSNEYGGYDSFTFINPQESRTISKNTYDKYNYQLNASGLYSTINKNIKNRDTVTLSSSTSSQYSVTTEPLDEVEYSWLMYLLESKDVYVECSDGVMYPIEITTTSKQVLRRKYSRQLLRFDLAYKAISGLNASPYELARFNNRVSQIGIIYNTPEFTSNGFYTTLIGDGTSSSFTITHGLNTTKSNIQLLEESTGNIVHGDITITGNNQILIEFGSAITSNQVRVNINKMI